MARGFNNVVLMGNITKEPDVRTLQSGKKVARVTLAISKSWTDGFGNPQTRTEFIPIIAWNGLAEVLEQYAHKGAPLLAEAHLASNDFDDPKTGVHRWTIEIIADQIILLPNGKMPEPKGSTEFNYGANKHG